MPPGCFNPFVPNLPFLYPLKTSEYLTVFWCFQGVEKRCTGNKSVKWLFGQLFRTTSRFRMSLREKCPNTEFFLVLFSCMRRLNTEIHSVNLRIQSEYRKIRTRKNAVFGHFSRRVCFTGNSTTTCYSLQVFATLHDLNRNFMKGIFYRYTSSF